MATADSFRQDYQRFLALIAMMEVTSIRWGLHPRVNLPRRQAVGLREAAVC